MLLYVRVEDVETMISLVLFPPCSRTYIMCQTIFNSTYWRMSEPPLLLHPCAFKHIQQEKENNNTSPPKLSSLSSGLFPKEVPDNINTQQFCLGARFREKKKKKKKQPPLHPSQHVVLLLLVYSLFRPAHQSWIWLATLRCGMTSDRAGCPWIRINLWKWLDH